MPDALPIRNAFSRCSASRQHSDNGPLPISMSDYRAYFEIADITDPDRRLYLLDLLQALDGLWLTKRYQKASP